MVPDLVWRPLRDEFALVKREDPIGDVEDDVHVVFD